MMVLNFSSSLFLTFYTEAIVGSVHFSAILQVRYRLLYFEFKRFYCRCFCCDYGNLSSGYDLSALNECTFVADRNIKLWHITAVILLDLMQFRFDNTGHISHLAGAFLVFFLFNYCKGN
jgi:hypothetical protein